MRVAVAASLAVVVGALAFDQAGFFPHSWIWAAVLFLWIAALALILRPEVRATRAQLVWVGSIAALSAWTLVTALWSDARAQTLLEARRDLVYVGAVAAFVSVGGRAVARSLPRALLVAIEIVLLAALVRYLVEPSAQRVVPQEGALLTWPLGYANAIAALAAMAMPLALVTAATGRQRWLRAAAAAGLAPALAALALTSSHGGEIAAAAAVLTLVLLDPRRAAVARMALVLAPVAAGVLAACALSDLTSTTLDPAGVRRGRLVVAVALLLGAAVMGVVASRVEIARRRGSVPRARLLLGTAATVAAVAAIVAALPRLGGDGVVRTLFGAPRAAYWDVAWTQIAGHPAGGAGAGTFARYWLLHGRVDLGGALDVHNVYLETLAELGPVGLALLLVALAVPLAVAPRAAARSRIGAATAAAYVAGIADAFVEWDWELPAVTVAILLLGGCLLALGARRDEWQALSGRARAAAVALAIVLGVAALTGVRSDTVPAATAGSPAVAAGPVP